MRGWRLSELESVDDLREGSLVVSRVESTLGCHDLRQPYFHKAVVLVLDHDPGDFTQGILLNRASDLSLPDSDIVYYDPESDEDDDEDPTVAPLPDASWRIHFGGDIGGWYEAVPQLLCLHGLSSEAALAVSDPILFDEDDDDEGGSAAAVVSLTSHLGARRLVAGGDATPGDFYTFSGFCGWEEGQLAREIERGSWCLASFDEDGGGASGKTPEATAANVDGERSRQRHPLLELLERHSWKNRGYDPRSGGLGFWHEVMADLWIDADVPPTTIDDPQPFSDLMVKEWATQRLLVTKQRNDDDDASSAAIDDADIFRAIRGTTAHAKEGALLRGSSAPDSPYLLTMQFLHRSTVLLLRETDEASVGVVLNLPTDDELVLRIAGEDRAFPIRYGGPSGKPDDDDDDEGGGARCFWFHDHPALKREGIGVPVSFSNDRPQGNDDDDDDDDDGGIHVCEEEDVREAIELGLASPSDFALIQGFCAWEKEEREGSAGGVAGQLRIGNLEVASTERREEVWKTLMEQDRLSSSDDLRTNRMLSERAWDLAAGFRPAAGNDDDDDDALPPRRVYDSGTDVAALADDAWFAWMKIFLLGNAVYYPEEL